MSVEKFGVLVPKVLFKDQTNETIQKVVNNYQEIAEIVKKYPEVKLTFLSIPPYSIHSWNLYQCPILYLRFSFNHSSPSVELRPGFAHHLILFSSGF
jgi:hypothetical protein